MPAQPTPAQLHVDRPLTNLSVAYQQDKAAFVAANVFPTIPVLHESDEYYVYPRGSFYRAGQLKPRGLGQRPRQAGYTLTTQNYRCEEWSLEVPIDDRQSRNADPMADPATASTYFLTEQAMINRETLWVSSYFETGIWSLDMTGVASDPSGSDEFLQWDAEDSDPIIQIRTILNTTRSKTGYRPNAAVFGPDAFEAFINNAEVRDRYKYTQGGVIDADIVASALKLDNVYVAGGVSNTADEGQDDAISYIADPFSVLLAYSAPNPGLYTPSAGYQFAWTGLLPGVDNAYGGVIERGRDELAHSDVMQMRQSFDQQLVASDLAVFMTGVSGTSYGSNL